MLIFLAVLTLVMLAFIVFSGRKMGRFTDLMMTVLFLFLIVLLSMAMWMEPSLPPSALSGTPDPIAKENRNSTDPDVAYGQQNEAYDEALAQEIGRQLADSHSN